jgi:hypothetical protein
MGKIKKAAAHRFDSLVVGSGNLKNGLSVR